VWSRDQDVSGDKPSSEQTTLVSSLDIYSALIASVR